MSKLIEFVEEMRARLSAVADTERTLIRALDDALARVDQELLADVRDVTLAHEARRIAILQELQGLASRIGAFPAIPQTPALAQATSAAEPTESARVGDWRQAVNNIKDDLDGFFGRDIQH